MTPNFLCTTDNQSFPSLEALEAHERSGHQIPGTPTKNVEINPEFAETLQRIKEAEKAKQLAPTEKQIIEHPKAPEIKPLKLEYTFTGTDQAGHPVTTLEIDINDTHFVIAYCEVEKTQILSWQVANLTPLNQDYLKTTAKPDPVVETVESVIIPKKEKKNGV